MIIALYRFVFTHFGNTEENLNDVEINRTVNNGSITFKNKCDGLNKRERWSEATIHNRTHEITFVHFFHCSTHRFR